MRATVLVLVSLWTSGCATVISGNAQEVELRSQPPGARAIIRSNDGLVQEVTTPAKVLLRTGPTHVVTMLAPGHRPSTAVVGKTINWWAILGGPLAMYDWVSGAIYDLDPGVLELRLPPAPPAADAPCGCAHGHAPCPHHHSSDPGEPPPAEE